MTSANPSTSGEHLNAPHLQPIFPDQQLSLPSHIVQTFSKLRCFVFFSLGLVVSMIAHKPSKKGLLVSSSTLEPLMSAPLVFQARCSGGSPLWCRFQEPGCPVWGTILHSSGRNNYLVSFHPIVCYYTRLDVVLLFVVQNSHLDFRSFSGRNNPYVTVDLVCPWEEVSSGSSYIAVFLLTVLILHLKRMETIRWQILPQYNSQNYGSLKSMAVNQSLDTRRSDE